jgi:hypothetical protein
MPEDNRSDVVEKFLADQKTLEDRKQGLIDDLLRQRDDALKAFDEKLAKLGWRGKDGSGRPKKSHHKATVPPSAETTARPKGKA